VFEDRWLIRRFNAGEAEALRRIYEKYKPALFAVAGALLHDRAAVEDVVHDVFVGFAGQAGRFELKGSLKGYLAVCAANRARNAGRRSGRLALERLREARPRALEQPDSSEAASEAEEHLLVMAALADLPPEQQQAIVLHVFGDLRFREIARHSGESVNTVKSRYRYGIRKLRSLLNGEVEP
jgi:RNA polymerase sigma-70 factor (ECF subfamily)